MEMIEDAVLLKNYLGESDRSEGRPAYKRILELLREEGIWGATVTRGVMGFGKRSVFHQASPLRLSQDLPVVVEAVDGKEKIERVVPKLAPYVWGGLVFTVPVQAHALVSG